MSHNNVAPTKVLLGTYFVNIDAGNWSLAKEQLVLVLDGANHLVPLKTASIVPVGWYNHQQSHTDATAKSATIVKTSKAHLRMCVGQATYNMVKELPVHEQWAKLESSFAATSSTVDRSAKLVELINMQPFVAGDDFDVWIATFNMSVKALNNAVKHAKSATTCTMCDPLDALIVKDWLCNLMPETFASTVNSVNDSDDLEKLVQQLRRAALGDCARREQTQAHIARVDQAQALAARLAPPSAPLARRMSPHGASGPRLPPPAKRIGYTGQPLDARKLRNIDKWPAGVSKKGRLGLYRTRCYLCYKDGHLANACTVLPHLLPKSRVDTLRAHKIYVTTEPACALLHNTLTQDDLEKVLATQALAQSVDDDDEMQEASAASWHVRISGEEGEQCLRTKALTLFLLDSGATRHMTTRLDLLHNYCPSPADRHVRVTGAFGSGGFASGTGKLRFPTGGKDMVLRDVLYVPGLEAELVSLNCLIKDGYNVRGTSASEALGLIVFRDTVDAHFQLCNKQFVLEASPLPPSFPRDSALNVTLPPSADLPLWHGRLGHSGVNAVLASRKVGSIGLNTAAVTPDLMQLVKDCVPCHLGKDAAHRSHAPATHRATAPFGQVYMDLWGPGSVVSLSGHRYLCGATDQFSRYQWLRGISAKSDATRSIKDLVVFANVQYPGSPFRTLVTDRGGEFMNRQLEDWLASRGVVHELSAPYEHGQMGLQERSWRSIFDKVCTALAQSGLPLFLWEEAAHAAVYALNLTAMSALDDSTPDLVLHASSNPVTEHHRPRGSRLRVWGCCALVPLLPEQRGHKLAPRSRHCFFVGYSQTSKVWRFYNPACRKVFELSQATFYEREFGRTHNAKDTRTLRRWNGMIHDGVLTTSAYPNDDIDDNESAPPADSSAVMNQ